MINYEEKDGAYIIGTTVFHNGDECRITSEPKMIGIGEFQEALVVEEFSRRTGETIVISTPRQEALDLERMKNERAEQQAAAKRVNEAVKAKMNG